MTTRRHLRRVVTIAVMAVAVRAGLGPAWAEEPVLVIEGRGWGHGVGMSQEGARTMGAGGASTEEILDKFYPGTTMGSSKATVRVLVLASANRSETLSFPGGGEVRAFPSGNQPSGFPLVVGPGGSVEVFREGSGYRAVASGQREASSRNMGPVSLISAESPVSSTVATLPTSTVATLPKSTSTTATTTTTVALAATTSTTATTAVTGAPPATPEPTTTTITAPQPPVATTLAPSPGVTAPGPLWAVPRSDGTTVVSSRGRRYRGAIEVGSDPEGRVSLVNHVDVESYLRGMGEVLDPDWPPAALRAQAIAARTYALRSEGASTALCDDDRCQVYLGQSAEYPAMDKAVSQTRGQVLLFGGALASTFYSANAGGFSATPAEGFGSNGVTYPYLPSAPYQTANPDPWTERAGMAEVGRRMAYPGQLSGARVNAAGPSGRATEITLEGDAGPMPVDGRSFASRLGLRSTLFALRPEVGQASPLPDPTDASVAQDLSLHFPVVDAADRAVAVAPARSPQSWTSGKVPSLLMLLFADALLMASRARTKARLAGRSFPSLHWRPDVSWRPPI